MTDGWLGRMLTRKPRMLVVVALADKMARIIWPLLADFVEKGRLKR